ncbi:MAG: SdpI family protein [Oscillospiraceae bacterium]|nr:SdpI family protein [Oscillospiraceae bacterium]
MIDFVKSLLTDFDPTALLPDLGALFSHLELVLRIAVLIGPLCLLGFGLCYLLIPAPEANHTYGYRFYWGMSSVEVWQFTQRLAGLVWTGMGLVMTIVMAVLCNGYRDLAQDAMLYSALTAICWEIGLIVASILVIDIIILVLFDRKGYRRQRLRR